MPKLLPHIGVPAPSRRVLPTLTTLAIMLVAVGLNVSKFAQHDAVEIQKAALLQAQPSTIPTALSDSDATLYRQAFALQAAGHLDDADQVAANTANPMLRGVLLGERYLTEGHEPSFSELALWLSRYGDHAQAAELYRIARERTPDDADFLTEPLTKSSLKGFSNGQGRSALGGEKHWVSGLAAFRRHDMNTATAHFKALYANGDSSLTTDDRAAVAFWVYRCVTAVGDEKEGLKYIAMAAEERPSFYSLLARRVMGESASQKAGMASADTDSFMQKGAVRRAIALKQIEQDALAEKELRTLFPGSAGEDRKRLVQLARTLNLPAAQMRMAVAAAYDASASDAFYPLPHWTPTVGYHVEPALLFAIMRQESGFNPNAKSASGALGVMQLMPATAHAMAADTRLKISPEPAVSMTLGQHYLERLMNVSAINDNLVFLIAAYNAGPGAVISWKKTLHSSDNTDPLLFIESIPVSQTRDYVERVMGNYWVYSEMLGGADNTSAAALLQNHWPHYERSEKQTVLMVSRLNTSRTE